MSDGFITREMLAAAGGLAFKMEEPEPLNIALCEKHETWPKGMPKPEVIVFFGTRVYERDARALATELGTTPRQISRLRTGKTDKAKPLSWYEKNRSSGEYGGHNDKHLPTGI
jgi:hypothetical protein